MNVIRKLKTAKKVLMDHGISEVFTLLEKNIELYVLRLSRFLGSRLRRICYRLFKNKQKSEDELLKVLYVTERMEVENGQTVRYRIYNLRQALKGKARTRFEIIENGIWSDRQGISWADIIVVMRSEWSPMLESLFKTARELKIPVVYDIDDIIFLERYVENFCSILPDDIAKSIEIFRGKFKKQEKTFRSADYATTSTHYIADIINKEGKHGFVIHNGLNKRQINIAKGIRLQKQNSIRTIGYLSGTATHNQDFRQALPALLKILEEYRDVQLSVVGYLDLEGIPQKFTPRIKTACFMDWKKLLRYSANNFINIAPLDISNQFCNAKSELKYFEAAIVGIPTVASATDTFIRCISHGENGMLAANDDDWYNAVKLLLDDDKLYNKMQYVAYKHVMENYSPQAIAEEAFNTYEKILQEFKSSQNLR